MLALPPPPAPRIPNPEYGGPTGASGASAYGTVPLALPAPPSPPPPSPGLPAGQHHRALSPSLRHQQHEEPWWGAVGRPTAPQAAAVGSSRPHAPGAASRARSLRSTRTSARSDAANSIATGTYRPAVGAAGARTVAPDRSYRPASTRAAPTSAPSAAAGVTGRATPTYGGRYGVGQGQGAASQPCAAVWSRESDLGAASTNPRPHAQASRRASIASDRSSTAAVAAMPYTTAAGTTAGGPLPRVQPW